MDYCWLLFGLLSLLLSLFLCSWLRLLYWLIWFLLCTYLLSSCFCLRFLFLKFLVSWCKLLFLIFIFLRFFKLSFKWSAFMILFQKLKLTLIREDSVVYRLQSEHTSTFMKLNKNLITYLILFLNYC